MSLPSMYFININMFTYKFIVCTPPPLPSCWEVAGKEGVTFFRGGCSFSTHTKKLKSETFNDKKLYEQKSFSLS